MRSLNLQCGLLAYGREYARIQGATIERPDVLGKPAGGSRGEFLRHTLYSAPHWQASSLDSATQLQTRRRCAVAADTQGLSTGGCVDSPHPTAVTEKPQPPIPRKK